jgi:hypothetical protein
VAGWTSSRPNRSAAAAAAPAPPTEAPPTDWTAIVAGLDVARARAFAAGNVTQLAGVDVAGSPAEQADAATLEAMRSRRAFARGLHPELVTVVARTVAGGRAELLVTDRLPPYTFVTADGAVLATAAGRGEASHLVTLFRTPAGWRITSVR